MPHFVDPDRDAFRQFAEKAIEGPVQMLNLIKLRERAAYDDGREASGAEAYKAYSAASAEFFEKVGGEITWRGVPQFPVIGPRDQVWDLGFVATYPSKDAFLQMVKDPGYQAIVFHRQAAVLDSRLYCFKTVESDGAFG
ncbi:DUF1330 domain-containing protein [Parvularcula lutaonensis]|uniref:DUF1330 domain-containing protein n=1 Tax=Parvularcula lutaonensis TaxID=491923 RepID=A0ABV7MC19_9PROT|nr:DUF1330 domain-containing protein [Parvularcula lutaonensis]GGY49754.1 hypothetical protein GCM10007148_17980 [Parvularcula lutaonensis]